MKQRLLLALGMAFATSAAAQGHLDDTQTWSSVRVASSVGHRLDVAGEGLLSLTDSSSQPGQVLLRAILTYRVNEQWSIGGGYTYFFVDDGLGSNYREHRTLQDLNFRSSLAADRSVISVRTRLEERKREGQDEVSFRLRQLTRFDVPISAGGLRAVAWNEGFYSINRTPWARSGWVSMLNFIGLGIAVGDAVSIEPGYLNQHFFDPGEDRVRHIVAVFISAP